MNEFRVWSPRAEAVSVRVGRAGGALTDHAMTGPDGRGYWTASVAGAAWGMDYGFLIDGDAAVYPDPRSAWQPEGVHALSRLYDQAAFAWSDAGWRGLPLETAVIYELHVGTFTAEGTFDGVVGRLDYLVELGITHLELLPVAAFPGGHGWGYDGVALFAVNEGYGGPDGLKRLVDACHARGLAVLLDVVYNHFGPVGNYTGKFGPYTTDKHHTPWGSAINFEGPGSDQVRRYFIDNALMWLREYHMDGLRLDAVHEFVDRSAVHFLEQMSAEVDALSAQLARRLALIAESDLNDPRVVTPRAAGGYGMDAQWSDDFHHALFSLLHPEERTGYYGDYGRVADLAKALTGMYVYDGQYSAYRGRSHGRPVEGLSAQRFLGFIQNHDQVGNRATGDRLEHIVGLRRAKVGLGLALLAPFVPMLFMGEEFAASTPFQYFADHDDPEMAKAVSEGRKREFAAFGWRPEAIPDPESRETFERSKLDWSEVHDGAHGEMLAWTKALIGLRRASASLNDGEAGRVTVEFDEEKRWLSMRRGTVLVVCNLGDEAVEVARPEGSGVLLASSGGVQTTAAGVRLPGDCLAVLG